MQEESSVVSKMIDSKEDSKMSGEEKFDVRMRLEGHWNIESWRMEKTEIGPDQLRVKTRQDPHDGRAELYADDSTASASGKTWEETKRKMGSTLQPVFENMKAARLKVNEDKTKLLVIASNQKRRAQGGLQVSMQIGGKEIKPESSAKSLGVIIGTDLSWKEQTKSKLTDCGSRLAALRNIQTLITKNRRKELAQSIVVSRLEYALEVTSTGRAKDMQDLQYLKVKLARWVLGARRLGWSTTRGFRKLGWMTIQQSVAFRSIRMGLKVLQNAQPEALYEKLTVLVRVKKQGLPLGMEHEERELRVISSEELLVMCAAKRKSWGVRTLRWLNIVPIAILGKFYETKSSKTELKRWVQENIPTTGDDILHGKFRKEGGNEGGDKDENEGNEPPPRKRGRGKTQGEEDIRRNKMGKARQQKFMMDWMKPGEKGDGGHTCQLGRRVRTGGIVTQTRKIEGLILSRLWRGDSNCTGCRNTDIEVNKEMVSAAEQEKINRGQKKCHEKSDEQDSNKIKTQRASTCKENKREKNTQTLLILMVVAIGRIWAQEGGLREAPQDINRKTLSARTGEAGQQELEARDESWIKSGVG